MSALCSNSAWDGGIAVRLSTYLECQARALAENGFQALAGGPMGAALLSGLLTIFIAIIGYRLISGETLGLRDGVNWAVRVGVVLALLTSWPAFQTLVYRVAVYGPAEVAALVLPAAGLPLDAHDVRIQQAYDTIRLGSDVRSNVGEAPESGQAAAAEQTPADRRQFQPPLPRTAALFVLATSGFTGLLRFTVGFLLAVAPFAIMSLLFNATVGLFNGWLRALGGFVIAAFGALIVSSVCLDFVEGELARQQALRSAITEAVDPQALTVIVLLFGLVMLITTFAALRMTSALKLSFGSSPPETRPESAYPPSRSSFLNPAANGSNAVAPIIAEIAPRSRGVAVADSLAATVRREQIAAPPASLDELFFRRSYNSSPDRGTGMALVTGGSHSVARRPLGRRTRGAARRDRMK